MTVSIFAMNRMMSYHLKLITRFILSFEDENEGKSSVNRTLNNVDDNGKIPRIPEFYLTEIYNLQFNKTRLLREF